MPGLSNTPLWSLIPAEDGRPLLARRGQSAGLRDCESSGYHLAGWWLRILLLLPLGQLRIRRNGMPPLVGLRGGWGRRGVKFKYNNPWHPESKLVGVGWRHNPVKSPQYSFIGVAGAVLR